LLQATLSDRELLARQRATEAAREPGCVSKSPRSPHPSSLFVQTGASAGHVSARGGAASGTAGPEPCAAGIKIVTANQVLGSLKRLKKHKLSKPRIEKRKEKKLS